MLLCHIPPRWNHTSQSQKWLNFGVSAPTLSATYSEKSLA